MSNKNAEEALVAVVVSGIIRPCPRIKHIPGPLSSFLHMRACGGHTGSFFFFGVGGDGCKQSSSLTPHASDTASAPADTLTQGEEGGSGGGGGLY